MENRSSIARFANAGRFCHAAREPELGELLRDPMTLALMRADHVDRRAFDALIAGARESLRWHAAN